MLSLPLSLSLCVCVVYVTFQSPPVRPNHRSTYHAPATFYYFVLPPPTPPPIPKLPFGRKKSSRPPCLLISQPSPSLSLASFPHDWGGGGEFFSPLSSFSSFHNS